MAFSSDLWLAAGELPKGGSHPFHQHLSELARQASVRRLRRRPLRAVLRHQDRPPVAAAGGYFRTLLVGYFEENDSERGSAWRLAESFLLRRFLALELDEPMPARCEQYFSDAATRSSGRKAGHRTG